MAEEDAVVPSSETDSDDDDHVGGQPREDDPPAVGHSTSTDPNDGSVGSSTIAVTEIAPESTASCTRAPVLQPEAPPAGTPHTPFLKRLLDAILRDSQHWCIVGHMPTFAMPYCWQCGCCLGNMLFNTPYPRDDCLRALQECPMCKISHPIKISSMGQNYKIPSVIEFLLNDQGFPLVRELTGFDMSEIEKLSKKRSKYQDALGVLRRNSDAVSAFEAIMDLCELMIDDDTSISFDPLNHEHGCDWLWNRLTDELCNECPCLTLGVHCFVLCYTLFVSPEHALSVEKKSPEMNLWRLAASSGCVPRTLLYIYTKLAIETRNRLTFTIHQNHYNLWDVACDPLGMLGKNVYTGDDKWKWFMSGGGCTLSYYALDFYWSKLPICRRDLNGQDETGEVPRERRDRLLKIVYALYNREEVYTDYIAGVSHLSTDG